MKKILKITAPFLIFPMIAFAQIPTDVPKPDDNVPVDFSKPVNIIIFIVLPLAIAIFYFIWRGRIKKDREKMDS